MVSSIWGIIQNVPKHTYNFDQFSSKKLCMPKLIKLKEQFKYDAIEATERFMRLRN